jgi:hypothetical protein
MLYACRTVAIPDRRCIEMIKIPHSGALPTQLRIFLFVAFLSSKLLLGSFFVSSLGHYLLEMSLCVW